MLLDQCLITSALLDNAAFALGREPWELVARGCNLYGLHTPNHSRGWWLGVPRQGLFEYWQRVVETVALRTEP
jgi:hypothetical protein